MMAAAFRKASSKLGIIPVPNQTMNRGAMEMFGTTCETTMIASYAAATMNT
jgi:hypothetical protein